MDILKKERIPHYIMWILPAVFILLPFVAFAQPQEVCTEEEVGSVLCLIWRLARVVNPLIALLTGFAILAFVRGVAVFIWTAENEEKRAEGKKFIMYGILGMFVLFGFWGIVRIITVFYFGGSVGNPFPAS